MAINWTPRTWAEGDVWDEHTANRLEDALRSIDYALDDVGGTAEAAAQQAAAAAARLDALEAGGGGGGGGNSDFVQIGTLTLPSSPTIGQSVTVLADSETVLPDDVTWDVGGKPTVGSRLLITFVWTGDDWVGTYGPPISVYVPADTVAPDAGTMSALSITSTTFSLHVLYASDDGGLHSKPYRFSLDNGSTWSAWQESEYYDVTGRTASTAYTCIHQVRDAALNITTGTPVVVTTTASVPGNVSPSWSATFTMGTPLPTGISATASAMATDDVGVVGYSVSYNGGSTWESITPSGSVFPLVGTAGTTYSTTKLRAVDASGEYSPTLSVPSYTLPLDAPLATVTYKTSFAGSSQTGVDIGPAPSGGGSRTVIVSWAAQGDGAPPSSCTIGGVTATRDTFYTAQATWQLGSSIAIFRANVPTGTTADIVATGGSGFEPRMHVWVADADLEVIEAKVTAPAANAATATVATVYNGFVVAAAIGYFGEGNPAYGWSVGMTTDEYAVRYHAAASSQTSESSKAVTWSGYRNRMAIASYRASA